MDNPKKRTMEDPTAVDFTMEDPSVADMDNAYLSTESFREKNMSFTEHNDDPDLLVRMTIAERLLFNDLLANATFYQEFGAGGTTVLALMHKHIQKVMTIDSNQPWIKLLSDREDITKAKRDGRLELVLAERRPVTAHGAPDEWPEYSGHYAESSTKFDLIFMNERFRVACLLKALARASLDQRNNMVFAMHGYTNHPKYHVVEKFVDKVKTINTLAVFRPKTSIDTALLNETIYTYDTNLDKE